MNSRYSMPALLLAACLTASCATRTLPVAPQMPPLPASLSSPCSALPLLPEGQGASMADEVLAAQEVTDLYGQCAAKHRATVEAYESARRALSPAD